jgi:hypothetical protein
MHDQRNADRLLHRAALFFLFGFAVHNADHARRGLHVVNEEVIWAGTMVSMIAAVTVTLLATRHRLGALVAAGAGFYIAFGVSASHLLPQWSPLSDPLPGGDVDAFTWIAVLLEVSGALALGIAGLLAVRTRRTETASSSSEVALGN